MSRVGLCLASFLTASGIGMVISAGRTPGAGPAAAFPRWTAIPRPATFPRRPALRAQRRTPAGRSFPARGNGPPAPASRHPDLVILADIYRRELPEILRRGGVRTGQRPAKRWLIGPLVLPGGRRACDAST